MISRSNIELIRSDLTAAIREVGAKYGVAFTIGRIRYSNLEMRCKLQGYSVGAPTTSTTPTTPTEPPPIDDSIERMAWASCCERYGLKAEHFKQKVLLGNGETAQYQLLAIKPSNRKYPIVAQRLHDRKMYKWPAAAIRKALGITI